MNGNISINRASDGMVRIHVEDNASRITFATLTMTPEAFGNAVTNLSNQPVEMELRGLHVVGKTAEWKTLNLPHEHGYSKDAHAEWLENAVAGHEVDGWQADRGEGCNRHKEGKDGVYQVIFRRYVDAEPGGTEA
jgi:hypothetical protein